MTSRSRPKKPSRLGVAKTRAVIAAFRRSGDPEPCLEALGIDRERPIIALQRALAQARDRVERDAIEDLGFVVSGGAMPDVAKLSGEVRRRVKRTYGPLALEGVDLEAFLVGLLSVARQPPPVAAIVAAIGIEAQRSAEITLAVPRSEKGKTLQVADRGCGDCGGQGKVFCPECLGRIRAQLDETPLGGLAKFTGRRPEDLAQDLLSAGTSSGCTSCNQEPVRACDCALEVSIPKGLRDGKIVKGRRKANGESPRVCLRLEGG